MEHKLSQLKRYKTISLSDAERARLRGSLSQMISTPTPARPSLVLRGIQHSLSIALSSFLFIIFVGGSMSAVASRALPGDPLYAYKRKINEEVRAALLNSPEEKIAFAQTRVENRVEEIKTLAQTKTLTKEKQLIAQKALDENIQDLSNQLSALPSESFDAALSVTADLEQELLQNKETIKSTLESSEDTETATATLEAIDGTLKKVSEQEVKIITKQIENIADQLEETAVDSVELEEAKGSVLGETTETSPSDPSTPVSP